MSAHTPMQPEGRQDSEFLQLPGEIRNLICSFALTSSHALHYRGTVAKVTPSRQAGGEADVKISVPPYQLIFREIYNDGVKAALPFNQLKNTCRQLESETKDLELKLNNIEVASDFVAWSYVTYCYHHYEPDDWDANNKTLVENLDRTRITAEERTYHLLRYLEPSRVSWLRNIIIRKDITSVDSYGKLTTMSHFIQPEFLLPQLRDTITHFDHFFEEHPNVSIRYVCPSFSTVPKECLLEDVLLLGVFILRAPRGVDMITLVPLRLQGVLNMLEPQTATDWRISSPNLVFWPFEADHIQDVEAFIATLCKSSKLTKAEMDPVLPYVQQWATHGL